MLQLQLIADCARRKCPQSPTRLPFFAVQARLLRNASLHGRGAELLAQRRWVGARGSEAVFDAHAEWAQRDAGGLGRPSFGFATTVQGQVERRGPGKHRRAREHV